MDGRSMAASSGSTATTAFPAPREAYYMAGAGGQTTLIVPSHDLVIVRQGHFSGAEPAREGFNRAVSLVLEAVRPA
jgi:hypothetical protein